MDRFAGGRRVCHGDPVNVAPDGPDVSDDPNGLVALVVGAIIVSSTGREHHDRMAAVIVP